MPQAMLIDINTAAITHRNGTLSGITDKNYAKVKRHLDCFNAALPAKYKVIVDSIQYNEKMKQNMVAVCDHCKENTDFQDLHIINSLLPKSEQLIIGHKYERIWVCNKCNHDNPQRTTLFIQSVRQQPDYLQCVPDAPKRDLGIAGRTTYDQEFEKWASNFLKELEAAAAKFRQQYKPKDQNDIDENSIDLSMEDDTA